MIRRIVERYEASDGIPSSKGYHLPKRLRVSRNREICFCRQGRTRYHSVDHGCSLSKNDTSKLGMRLGPQSP